jgi:tetratricopeptide (TPR) repeat protein
VRSSLLLLAALFLLTGWSFFDPFHEHVEKGNREARAAQPDSALKRYEEAARIDPGNPIPDFNRGIVLSGKGEHGVAKDAFAAAAASEDPEIAADALFNLGNVLMANQELGPAVESYLASLDLDPDDADAQKNLEIAFRLLEEQQQQQQQQQEDQEQQKQENDQQQQEKEEPSEEPSEEPNQNESPDSEQQQEETPEPRPEEVPPEERLSREDAERLLNAIESDELKVLQQLQAKEGESKEVVSNDW